MPDYWEALVEKEYNIILTPRGNYNLYIKEQKLDYFIIAKVNIEQQLINSETKFDYLCIGERKDFKIQVVQNKN